MSEQTMTLQVSTGAQLIELQNENGTKIGQFEFVPTDVGIIERYRKVADFFDTYQLPKEPTEEDLLALENSVREQFDLLFGYHVSDGMFENCAALTVVEDGDFFFEKVLDGISGLIEKTMKARVERKKQKIRKYTAKYGK